MPTVAPPPGAPAFVGGSRRSGPRRRNLWGAGLTLLCAIIQTGCVAGRYVRAARRVRGHNAHAAIEYIALAQERNPNHGGAHDTLIDILQTIPYDHEQTVKRLEAAGSYDQAVAECDRMIATDHLVRSLPGGQYNLYYRPEQRAELARKAAAQWYERAREHQAAGRLREAVTAYDRCLGFRMDFEEAATLRENAMAGARTRLFLATPDPRDHPYWVAGLPRAIGVEATRHRPRFLQITNERARANAVGTLSVDQAEFYDSGWHGREDSRTVVTERIDPQSGKARRTRHRAHWVVYSRETSYTLTLRFSVEADDPEQPAPAQTFSRNRREHGSYVQWSGSRLAVPPHILYLSRFPAPVMDEASLRRPLIEEATRHFGETLFLAYK